MRPHPLQLHSLLHYSLILSSLVNWQMAQAEGGIVTDGSTGAGQALQGPQVTIPQDLGTTVGQNLFHSFTDFNINPGQTVTFTENSPNALNNVIARVTGDSRSDINGSLSVTPGGQANFFLLNPNGILFGQGAVLDVQGAFHASTASQLNFADGKVFSAENPASSSLSSVEPASFGFLASSMNNNGLLQVQDASLEVKNGETLDLVGKEINTDYATLNAPGGEIRLVAMQGAGEVGLQQVEGVLPLPETMPTANTAGKITSNNTFIKTTGDGGGRVGLWGAKVTLYAEDASKSQGIDAFNTNAIHAALQQGINIKVEHLILDGVRVRTEPLSSGNAGHINVQATQDIALLNGGRINSAAQNDSSGSTGNVTISVGGDLSIDGKKTPTGNISEISTKAFDNSTGKVGDVNVSTERDVTITRGGSIYSGINNKHQGDSGNINLTVDRDLIMDGKDSPAGSPTNISTAARDESQGDIGNVNISVGRNMQLNEEGLVYANTENQKGNAGHVNLWVQGDIVTRAGSQIYSSVGTDDRAGSVSLTANGDMTIGGTIAMVAEQGKQTADIGQLTVIARRDLNILPSGLIITQTHSARNAANLDVYAGRNLTVEGNVKSITPTTINEGKPNPGTGHSGDITVYAGGDILLDKGYLGSIGNHKSLGKSGNINLYSEGNLTIRNKGAAISTSTSSDDVKSGGGNIDINVKKNILIENDRANIGSGTFSKANAGDVMVVTGGNLTLQNTGGINATSTAEGDAGNIVVNAKGNINLDQGGNIGVPSSALSDAEKPASGDAGKIEVHAQGAINLTNSSSISAFTSGLGQGGDVIVDAESDLQLNNKSTISSHTDSSGFAGKVTVTANNIFLENSLIASSSQGVNSSGQTGQISLVASNDIVLDNASGISIENQAVLNEAAAQAITPSTIHISARDIKLTAASAISATTSGNNAAGNIQINFSHWLTQDSNSKLQTTAATGNGGSITIEGAELLSLRRSNIETTVKNGQGNGGDINITADILMMDTAGIQANAKNGNGGIILLNLKALTASGDEVIVDGQKILWDALKPTFNIIQAVSDNGVNGTPNTKLQFNLSGVLSNLGNSLFDTSFISQEYCNLGAGTTLTRQGKGGLLPKGNDFRF